MKTSARRRHGGRSRSEANAEHVTQRMRGIDGEDERATTAAGGGERAGGSAGRLPDAAFPPDQLQTCG